MAVMLLKPSLLVVTVIQLTSSQPTHDVIQQDNDVIVSCCERSEQVLSKLQSANTQLQRDIAELKAAVGLTRTVTGKLNNHHIHIDRQSSSASSHQCTKTCFPPLTPLAELTTLPRRPK